MKRERQRRQPGRTERRERALRRLVDFGREAMQRLLDRAVAPPLYSLTG